MTAIKLFTLEGGSATEILGSATVLEKSLQHLIEQNLEAMLGIRVKGGVNLDHFGGAKVDQLVKG